MIASILVLSTLSKITVAEFVEPNAASVTVVATVRAPKIPSHQLASWYVLGEVLTYGSKQYSRSQLLGFGGQAGSSPRLVVTKDLIQLRIEAPGGKEGLAIASDLVSTVIMSPRFDISNIKESIAKYRDANLNSWSRILEPLQMNFDSVTSDSIQRLYQETFHAENISFAVVGKFEPGEGKDDIEHRFALWQAPTRQRSDSAEPKTRISNDGFKVSLLELSAQSSKTFALDLVSVCALGAGKSSAMYETLRVKNGWSYLQQSLLWPTSTGWEPRLVMAFDPDANRFTVTDVREALATAIKGWTNDDLERAKTIAKACLAGNFPLTPLWMGDQNALNTTASSRAGFLGFCASYGMLDARVEYFKQVDGISLENLQLRASEIVNSPRASLIPAKPY